MKTASPHHWLTVVRRWATGRDFEQKEFFVSLVVGACVDLYNDSQRKDQTETRRTSAIQYIKSAVFEVDCERIGINPDFMRREIVDHGPNITMGEIT